MAAPGSDMEAPLLGTADGDLPRWMARLQAASKPLYSTGTQLAVALFSAALIGSSAVAVAHGALESGHAHSTGCAVRASLYWVVMSVQVFADLISMFCFMHDPSLPTVYDADANTEAIRRSFADFPTNFVVVLVLNLTPTLLWLRNGGLAMGAIVVGLVALWLPIYLVATCQFSYLAQLATVSQEGMEKALEEGHLSYDAALDMYNEVKAVRRVASSMLTKTCNIIFPLYLFSMGVMLYDFELMPWGHWPLGLAFLTNMVAMMAFMEPFVGLNDWPDKFARLVMEARALGWTPTDRTNFVTYVKTTRVHVRFLEFEMGHSFRVALPAFFFGWWLYVTELRQFHAFAGLPFDRHCARELSP